MNSLQSTEMVCFITGTMISVPLQVLPKVSRLPCRLCRFSRKSCLSLPDSRPTKYSADDFNVNACRDGAALLKSRALTYAVRPAPVSTTIESLNLSISVIVHSKRLFPEVIPAVFLGDLFKEYRIPDVKGDCDLKG